MYVLTANDDDSILAGKILISMNAHTHDIEQPHRAPGSSNNDIEPGAKVMFIRPYLKPGAFLGHNGYAKTNNCVLFEFDTAEIYTHASELSEAGVECHWVSPKTTLSEYVWEYQHPGITPPKVVLWVRDYMKWELKYPESTFLHYALSILRNKRSVENSNMYARLLAADEDTLVRLLRDGEDIQLFVSEYYATLAKELIFDAYLGVHSGLAANAPGVNSTFFSDNRPDHTAYEFAATFSHDLSRNNIKHTLFQIDPELSMRTMAAKYGDGGGHVGVAGFVSGVMQIHPEFSPIEFDAYMDMIGTADLPDHIVTYVNNVLCVKGWAAKSMLYDGIECIVSNTPHLTQMPLFGNVRAVREQIGLTVCLRADGMFRVAATSIASHGSDVGERFGKKYGPYRIQIMTRIELMEKFNGIAILPK